jgi:hypothetical protein
MLPSQYEELFEKLSERTQRGAVNWHPTADENEFVVYFRGFSLSVRFYESERDASEMYFKIRDDSGKEVDTFWISENDIRWEMAYRIYSSARRKALRIDEAVNSIVKQLDNAPTVGLEKPPGTEEEDDIPF